MKWKDVCVCMSVCVSVRVRVCVCVCVRDRERECVCVFHCYNKWDTWLTFIYFFLGIVDGTALDERNDAVRKHLRMDAQIPVIFQRWQNGVRNPADSHLCADDNGNLLMKFCFQPPKKQRFGSGKFWWRFRFRFHFVKKNFKASASASIWMKNFS